MSEMRLGTAVLAVSEFEVGNDKHIYIHMYIKGRSKRRYDGDTMICNSQQKGDPSQVLVAAIMGYTDTSSNNEGIQWQRIGSINPKRK